MKTRVVQIVPRVPPAVCGVGDHAWLIALRLRQEHDIESTFVFCDPECDDVSDRSEFKCVRVEKGNAAALASLLATETTVVLHLSGYGYARNGAPVWVASALETLRAGPHGPRIITMFHELFVTGSFFSSAFWRKFAQQRVLRRICRASDVVRTNRREYARWLEKAGNLPSVLSMPVIANFGEDSSPLPPSRRENKLVLFQPPGADSPFWEVWRRVDALIRPAQTIIAGRAQTLPPDAPVDRTGLLSFDAAGALLSEARFVLMDYYPGYLGKSSLFASLAGRGVACILASANDSSADGLNCSIHFLSGYDLAPDRLIERADASAAALHAWYQGHSVSVTAASYARQILESDHAD